MKNLLLLCIFFVVSASSCKKKQPIDYLPGSWGVTTMKENGVDKTNEFLTTYQAYQFNMDAKGNYSIFYIKSGVEIAIDGTWTLDNNNQQLTLVDNDPKSAKKIRVLNILNTISDKALTLGEDGKEYYFDKIN